MASDAPIPGPSEPWPWVVSSAAGAQHALPCMGPPGLWFLSPAESKCTPTLKLQREQQEAKTDSPRAPGINQNGSRPQASVSSLFWSTCPLLSTPRPGSHAGSQ